MPAVGFKEYPYLTRQEFDRCINGFMEKYADALAASDRYTARIVGGSGSSRKYLEIQASLHSTAQTDQSGSTNNIEDLEEHQDLEDLEDTDPLYTVSHPQSTEPNISTAPIAQVQYHVLYSSTWRVPMMYMRVTTGSTGVVTSMDEIRQMLICDQQVRQAVEAVEYGGALGIQDHPELGVPYMYVHPCHTATLLRTVALGTDVNIGCSEYIAAWVSLIGAAIGLALPAVKD
ncbi:hypothetical protein FB645_005319 [Coemansia sp. IMI 203386]|nr:hypothetical protein FB645_005319 [Coemansia sp. IMI 203386]